MLSQSVLYLLEIGKFGRMLTLNMGVCAHETQQKIHILIDCRTKVISICERV